jgi:LCP family protein required for cell wall assembly
MTAPAGGANAAMAGPGHPGSAAARGHAIANAASNGAMPVVGGNSGAFAVVGRSMGTGNGRPVKTAAKRRSPVWAKVLVGLGALILVAGLGAIAVVNLELRQIDHSIKKENLLGTAAAPFTGTTISGPLNILLVGSDKRASQTGGGNSDTIIVVHIPASHDRAYLISIPRDTGVRIPAFPKSHYGGGSAKINAAFTFGSQSGAGDEGGFQLLAETIKQNYGITFNGGAIVDFGGFKDILNQLNGVSMYVDETTYSIRYGHDIKTGKLTAPYHINPETGVPYCPNGGSFDSNPLKCAIPGVQPIVYKVGYQHLTPSEALDYVRARDGLVGTDYARQRHQQQFIKALVQEMFDKGLNDPFKLQRFISSISKAFVIDSSISITDWIFTLKGITPNTLIAIKTNDGKTVDYDGSAGSIAGSVQSLNSDSKDLLAAVTKDKTATDDNVGLFLQTHQDWAAN